MMNQKREDPSVDDVVMSAAALALASPAESRQAYIHGACGGDPELIRQVRDYLEWEERMDGFLEESLLAPDEPPFQRGDLADGRFDIVRDAGEGGMGWVYEGWDRQLNCRVAIKCSKAGFHKRLPPEVLHAREIAHRHVCRVFDIHTAQTRRGEIEFISMEFLEGETLAAQLAHARLSKREALGLARQICAGLAEAHRQGVVHGDVKSNNVFITRDADGHERAVVTDFGLARRPGTAGIRGTAQSMLGGAMDYVAPEVWNGGKATSASDVYGLGVILCELFAGRRPFGPDARIEQRFQGKPPGLGTKWDRLLTRCLEPDPARRFRSAGEVADAIAPGIKVWRWYVTAAAAAVAIAAVGSIETNRYLSKEPVRLALDPIEASSTDLAGLAAKLTHDVAGQLAKMKGGDKFRLSFIPPEKARAAGNATSVLHVTLNSESGKLLVHAELTDARSKSRIKDWTPAYAPGEERYIPVALAGIVTSNLNLPPLAVAPSINANARQDYWSGMWYLRRASGFDAALPYLERAVSVDPDSALIFAALAEARWRKYYSTKDDRWLDGAREAEREAELRNPDLAPVHRVGGLLLKNDGEYERAESEYRRAIFLDPGDGDAHIRLAMVHEARNQLDQALEEYRSAVAVEPAYYKPYQDLGAFYYARGRFTEAATYYERAVNLAPDEPELRQGLAAIYMLAGRFAEARNQLQESIRLKETQQAVLQLGMTQMYLGDDRAAVATFQRALSLTEPGHATRYLSLMYLGIAYRRLQLTQLAKEVNQEGLRLAIADAAHNPRDGYRQTFVAYFDAALGNSRAKSEIDAAVHLSHEDAETRWNAVLAYEALGLRIETLNLLNSSSAEQIADVSRWPDLADLHNDPRFKGLVLSHHVN